MTETAEDIGLVGPRPPLRLVMPDYRDVRSTKERSLAEIAKLRETLLGMDRPNPFLDHLRSPRTA